MVENSSTVPNGQEPVPQWKRPAGMPSPIGESSGKTKKSIFKRAVPWQMTVGAILLIVSVLFSFLVDATFF